MERSWPTHARLRALKPTRWSSHLTHSSGCLSRTRSSCSPIVCQTSGAPGRRGSVRQAAPKLTAGRGHVKRTPAMAAGVADRIWTMNEIAGLLDFNPDNTVSGVVHRHGYTRRGEVMLRV